MSAQPPNAPPAKRPRVGERTMLACINCKQRKLKCDGQSPRCKNCVRTDRDCLVEDPATGLHRPRDYIRSLEARVAYLEGMLQELRPEVALDHFEGTGTADPTGSSHLEPSRQLQQLPPPGNSPGDEAARGTGGENGSIDVLSNEVALLCLSAAGREPQYFGPSSAVPFSRIVSTTIGLPGGRTGLGTTRESDDGTRRSLPTVEFPSRAKMAELSNAYFKNIHPQYPFLHRPTFEHMEKECRDASLRGDPTTASDMSLFFVLMVCAIGSRALGPAEAELSECYYSMAIDHIGPLLDLDNLHSVQAILACAVYSIRSPAGVSLWKISGMAIRHCVELGYHRSAERSRPLANPLVKEMSKRCFWVAYDIDRCASFTLGRPVGIPDQAIDAEVPLDINDEYITAEGITGTARSNPSEPPTTMTGALHALKLRQLWSKFEISLYSNISYARNGSMTQQGASIETLRQELEEWRATIPKQPGSSQDHALSVFRSNDYWFHLAYDYSILLLYRPYITENPSVAQEMHSPSNHHNTQDLRERALEICCERARNMCILYRRIYQSQGSGIQFTWGSLHHLLLGGLTYLYCLWRSPQIRQKTRPTTVMNTCMACTTILVIIAERWSQAASYRDIFETLSERTINMICGESSGEPLPVANNPNQDTASQMPHGNDSLDLRGLSCEAEPDPIPPDAFLPLQDWITELDYLPAPGDPQWLAQELLDGIRGFEAETSQHDLHS